MYLEASKNHGKWTVTPNWYTKPEVNHCELIHKAHNGVSLFLALPCLPKHTHTQHRPHKWLSRLTRWGKLAMGPPYRKPRVLLALSFYSGHDTSSKDHNTEPKGLKNSLSIVHFISREHLHTGNVQSRTHIGGIFSVVDPIRIHIHILVHAREHTLKYTHTRTRTHIHASAHTPTHTHS